MTLVEVMVAVVLLATIFLGALSALPVLTDSQRRADQITVGTALAQRTLEGARRTDFAMLHSFSGETSIRSVSNGVTRAENFVYQVDVSVVSAELKSVTVTVSGPHQKRAVQVVLQTLVLGDGGKL